MTIPISRRHFLGLMPPALGALLLAACAGSDDEPDAPTAAASPLQTEPTSSSGTTSPAQLATTPACGDDDEPTPAQTDGPFFTPDSPLRTSLIENGVSGTPLRLSGEVVNTDCEPIENALIDFWHTDDQGEYDNVGYRLRGHQFTNASGSYRLETIVPAPYPGRTRHIHVKVQAPGRSVLTTQLYFPNEQRNDSDGIFDPALLIDMADTDATQLGSFRLVLDV